MRFRTESTCGDAQHGRQVAPLLSPTDSTARQVDWTMCACSGVMRPFLLREKAAPAPPPEKSGAGAIVLAQALCHPSRPDFEAFSGGGAPCAGTEALPWTLKVRHSLT